MSWICVRKMRDITLILMRHVHDITAKSEQRLITVFKYLHTDIKATSTRHQSEFRRASTRYQMRMRERRGQVTS